MKVTMIINTDNQAFELNAGQELTRILLELSCDEHLQDWEGNHGFALNVRDINGNKIGEIKGEK